MKLLTPQEIKEIELELMERQGLSLNHFAQSNDPSFFCPLSNPKTFPQLRSLSVREARLVNKGQNSNIEAFCWALLTIIYSGELKEDMLITLKSTIYSPLLDSQVIEETEEKSISNLSLQQMRKLMVEFFYQIIYSTVQNKVEERLKKNPIILEIMVFFMRKMLSSYNLDHSKSYKTPVSTRDIFKLLMDIFDLNYKIEQNLLLLYQEEIFIYEFRHKQLVFGFYDKSVPLKVKSRQKNSVFSSQTVQKQMIAQQPPSNYKNNSFEFGEIRESAIMEVDADTPSFNFDESQASFRSSLVSENQSEQLFKNKQNQRQPRVSFMRESAIKANDLMNNMKQSQGLFGSINVEIGKASMKNQVKKQQKICRGFEAIIDIGNKANTPKTDVFEKQQQSAFKNSDHLMRKSKSLLLDKTLCSCFEDYKLVYPCYSQQRAKGQDKCVCFCQKKIKNILNSNLYCINIRCITNGEISQNSDRVQTFVTSQGVSQEIYFKKAPQIHLHRLSMQIPYKKIKIGGNDQFQTKMFPFPLKNANKLEKNDSSHLNIKQTENQKKYKTIALNGCGSSKKISGRNKNPDFKPFLWNKKKV